MNNWIYRPDLSTLKQIESIEDFPKDCVGFVYRITNLVNNKFYIGKKQLKSARNIRLGKKEAKKIAESITGKGRRPSKKKVISETNWKEYYGSCKPLLEDIKNIGEDKFMREILCFCYNMKELTYKEIYYQIHNKVLEKPQYTDNQNILGKFFANDLKHNP